ncbi:DUF6192 family protein [Phaeacidiphilus oryzae]|uniref:DUF6192 family protein n=1 Tax=Phaeacidiphilus oryzae TaxID=348818 RepID=UPI0013774C82|nr:DUF6192 family protein [Phaeacidiphilus oryzae]
MPYNTIKDRRWTASRWPRARARTFPSTSTASWAAVGDDAERFETIDAPPLDERTGRRRWTPDSAARRADYRARRPETPVEKVKAIHELAVDDQVAAQVARDLLRRPPGRGGGTRPGEGTGDPRARPR